MAKKKVAETAAVKKAGIKSAANGNVNGGVDTPKTKKASLKRKAQVAEDEDDEAPALPPKGKKRKVKVEKEDGEAIEASGGGEVVQKKTKQKRKTKEEKAAERMPLAPRTFGHKLFIGAHVSASGGQYPRTLSCS